MILDPSRKATEAELSQSSGRFAEIWSTIAQDFFTDPEIRPFIIFHKSESSVQLNMPYLLEYIEISGPEADIDLSLASRTQILFKVLRLMIPEKKSAKNSSDTSFRSAVYQAQIVKFLKQAHPLTKSFEEV